MSSDDWAGLNKNEIFNRVTNGVKNGSIILFHDGHEEKRGKELIRSLPRIIEVLKRKYKLVRLDQMKF